MRSARLAAASLALATLVACAGIHNAVRQRVHPGAPGRSETRTVRVILSHFRFAPDNLTVKSGTSVRFVLVNSDLVDHEFVLGSAELQQEHERMGMSGRHMMRGPGMVDVPQGKTVNLSYTFSRAGTLIYGCHVDDHYAKGMKGTVTVNS